MDDETTADSVLPLSDTSADQLSVSSLIEKFETAKKRQPQADNISNSSGSSKSSTDNSDKPVLMIRLADVQHRLYLAESHVRLYMATTKINRVNFASWLFSDFLVFVNPILKYLCRVAFTVI